MSVAVVGMNEQVSLMTLTFGRDSWSLSGPGAAAEVAAVLAGTSGPYRDLPQNRGEGGPCMGEILGMAVLMR